MSDTGQLPPEAQLFQTLFGFMVTRTLSAVAELNVADALRDGPRSYTDLAQAVGASARSRQQGVSAVGGDVCSLPFVDRSFDVVLSNSTLDHMDSLDDVSAALKELYRVLKPGGRLLLTLDNLANPVVALRNALPTRLLSALRLVPYYVGATCGPSHLCRLVSNAGFRTE